MNDRTCIVTRVAGDADELIRFVLAPDGTVVPDLKLALPGRGCWVTAKRAQVEMAVRRRLFGRALRTEVSVPADLPEQVDRLLVKNALGSLGLARKAGRVTLGAVQVESAVRSGEALFVLHATEASPDGLRKIANARRAVFYAGGPEIEAYKLFGEAELGLALGGTNVIHAAALGGGAGEAAHKRLLALCRYRGEVPEQSATKNNAAKDTE
jgi:hypothetical protein